MGMDEDGNINSGILNPEIYAQILSNLEKIDLLNSRLVSRAWNKECMLIFKKPCSKFRQVLDSKEAADEFINFVSSFNPPRSILPIHLKFQSIEGDDEFADEDDVEVIEKAKTKYHEFRITVQKLIELLGPESIRDLTFTYSPPYENGFMQGLCQILMDLSPGLQKLNLTIDCQLTEDVNIENFILPHVRHLKSSTCSRGPEDGGRNTVWKLIRACPNLEKLNVWVIFEEDAEDWTDPFPPPQLKSLSLVQFSYNWLLEKLRTATAQPNGLNLQEFRIKSEFGFDIMGRGKYVATCLDILAILSPSLVRLSLPLNSTQGGCYCCSPWIDTPTEVPFPRIMPKLKYLEIISPGKLNSIIIDPLLFPALESMSLPYVDTILNMVPRADWDRQFPKVKSLSTGCANTDNAPRRPVRDPRLPPPPPDPIKLSISETLENFLHIFPALKKISIKKSEYENSIDVKRVMKGLSRARGAEKIQIVELKNCGENCLGEIMEQIQNPPRVVLDNVRRNPLLDDSLLKMFQKITGGSDLRFVEEKGQGQGQPDLLPLTIAEESPFELHLTNVKKVMIELSLKSLKKIIADLNEELETYADTRPVEESLKALKAKKPMHLTAMLRNFPDLEEIQVSSHIFAPDAVSRAERIKRINEKFPGLRINII